MSPRLWHPLVVLALLGDGACKAVRDAEPRNLERLPMREHVPPRPTPHVLAALGKDSLGNPCVRLEPAGVAIQGQLLTEVHVGPPGYGETPAADERDTVVVVQARAPLRVCADTAAVAAATPGSSAEITRFQLQGVSAAVWSHIGEIVTVYGALQVREWGAHFTPIILWVDSIPALRAPPIVRRQSASE